MTIPKPLRDSLGLEPGHELEFEEREGALIVRPLRDSLGLEPGHELEFEEREGALIVRRRPPVDPLRRLVGLVGQRIDVDAYLDETRGPASHADQAAQEDRSS